MNVFQTYFIKDVSDDLLKRLVYISLTTFIVVIGYLFLSSPANASLWVSTQEMKAPGYTGTFSWPSEESDVVICHDTAGCIMAICHYSLEPREMCVNPVAALTQVYIPYNSTPKSARLIFIAKYGVSGTWSTSSIVLRAPDTCFGMIYWQGTQKYDNMTGKIIPGSYCGIVPPKNVTCDFIGDLIFDHGVITPTEIQNATKVESIGIQCTAASTVNLQLVGNNQIALGGGISSTLFFNETDLSLGVKIPISPAATFINVPITSKLSSLTQNLTPGSYVGSGTIVLSFQ